MAKRISKGPRRPKIRAVVTATPPVHHSVVHHFHHMVPRPLARPVAPIGGAPLARPLLPQRPLVPPLAGGVGGGVGGVPRPPGPFTVPGPAGPAPAAPLPGAMGPMGPRRGPFGY